MVPPGSDPYDLLDLFSPFLPVLCMHVWYSQENVHEQPLPWLWVLIPHAAHPIKEKYLCLASFVFALNVVFPLSCLFQIMVLTSPGLKLLGRLWRCQGGFRQ